MLDWAKANGIGSDLRGHTLVWDYGQSDLEEIYGSEIMAGTEEAKALMQQKIKEHISYVAQQFPDLTDIDVSNEDASRLGVTSYNTFKRIYGWDVLKEWYKAARESFPNAKLALTDGFGGAAKNTAMWENNYKPFLEWAVENLDFDTIGMQGHTGYGFDPEAAVTDLEVLSGYGKTIKITELDCSVKDDPDYQGNVIRDALIVNFACEAVDKIQLWGMQDYNSVGTERPLYYNDFTLKPGGKAYQDLVYNKWWTRESGKTDSDGVFSTKGFYGDYTVSVKVNGVETACDIPFRKENAGQSVTLTLTDDATLLLGEFNDGESITVMKNITNTDLEDTYARIIFAVYSAEGAFKNSVVGELTKIPAGEEICLSLSIDKVKKTAKDDYCRAFIWDDRLVPLK